MDCPICDTEMKEDYGVQWYEDDEKEYDYEVFYGWECAKCRIKYNADGEEL